MQCYGAIQIVNGSTVDAGGGVGTGNVGDADGCIGTLHPDPQDAGVIYGRGGRGGDGYVRLEYDTYTLEGSNVIGVTSEAKFRPVPVSGSPVGDFPVHPGSRMVVNISQGFSRWFNSQLDTPTYVAVYDDPNTPEVEGTKFSAFGQMVDILARTAPGDVDSPGRPNLFLATPWTALDDLGTISDRRFLQFRVDFQIGLAYTFDQPRPFVDCVSIAVQFN